MLLALDVGNTHVVGGLFDGERLAASWRVNTQPNATADELLVLWRGLFTARSIDTAVLDGACLASVVPAATPGYQQLLERAFDLRTLLVGVGTGVDLGLEVQVASPTEAGADRIANALAARERYGKPSIVVDFGTTTNFDVVSPEGNYIGGALAPGVTASLEALASRAAKLFRVPLARPAAAIGRDTATAMQSGAVFGYVGLVEGLIDRISAELGGAPVVIATGGLARLIAPETRKIGVVDPDLTLHGIRLIWERNAK
ncbi:MAG TPA: type III pantothenate kinase [Chloroflexota bacterium]|nr:type III pantothenate kinase [Chloroflexota bacterium]